VYGSRQRSDGEAAVVAEFLSRIEQGEPLKIHNSGRQTRNFIYVDDAVEATLLAAKVSRASGEVVNIGTGTPTSILKLANKLAALVGDSTLRKARAKPRAGDTLGSCADTFKAKTILGFEARTRLSARLRRLIQSKRAS
jgi:nucleoside-diphosphate-sugar epimerase